MHAPVAEPSVLVRRRISGRGGQWAVAAALMLAAFAIRGWQFGTPFLHVDEDFYLFVGDRMLHGALPYIDIWDRKPIGLFLLYAGIRLLGGGGIVQYQVVATLFAGATAAVVARISSRYAPRFATIAAGLLYLALLGLNDGMGGQSPVFYNLFVALAALLTVEATTASADPARIRRLGLGAMALCGIAMQLKYNVVFEGVFFGLALVRAALRAGRGLRGVMIDAALWIVVATVPTLLAFGYYAARGDASAFVYANFLSIFGRSSGEGAMALKRLVHTLAIFALPLVCVALAIWSKPILPGRRAASSYRFALAWFGAAVAGYLIFGTYFVHYALPLAAPVSAAAAPLFGLRRWRAGVIAAMLVLGLAGRHYVFEAKSNLRTRGGAPALALATATIDPQLRRGCLWVYRGDALFYYQTRSCLLSRYAFPGHLWQKSEAAAIGVDPLVEIRRILALRPAAIVDTMLRHDSDVNPAADLIVDAALARDYRLAAATGAPTSASRIYVRRD